MSESESRPTFPSGESFGVYGEYIDISLKTPKALAKRLDEANKAPLKLIDSELLDTKLPRPIEKVLFEALAPQTGDTMPTLFASVEMSTEDIDAFTPAAEDTSWDKLYLTMLHSFLRTSGYTLETLPHDINSLHVRLDHNYATSIKLTSNLNSFAVELSLETIDELENALGEMSEVPPDEPSNPIIVTQHFATALGAVIDSGLETFDTPRPVRHLLELTPATSKRIKAKVAQNALALTEMQFPEAEKLSRQGALERLPGVFAAKDRLKEIAEDFGDSEGAFLYEIAPTHFLLYGPPGTGKSSLVRAFADEIQAQYTLVPTSSVHGENVGSSAINLQKIFDTAFQDNQPKVLFFDEFETIGLARNSGSNHLEARKLFQQLILQTTKEHPNIVIAAAMNADKADIEPGLLRSGRLETIPVPLPTTEERLNIISTILTASLARPDILDVELATVDYTTGIADEGFWLYDKSISCTEFARLTDGLSIADITDILNVARRIAYRRYRATQTLEPVNHQDILGALDRFNHR